MKQSPFRQVVRDWMIGGCKALLLLTLITAARVHTQTAQQAAEAPSVSLNVGGEVARPLKLSAAELAKLPRATVRTSDHGTEATFEGVPLTEVLKMGAMGATSCQLNRAPCLTGLQ